MSKGLRLTIIAATIVIALVVGFVALRDTATAEEKYINFTDSTGETVKIPEHPKRVVILNASNVDMYYGAGGTVVGRPSTTAYDEKLKERLADVTEIGNIHSPNVETIISLNPDLVIGVDVPFHTNLRETLAAASIPLIINKLDAYEDVLTTLDFYGKLTGNSAAANSEKERIIKAHDEIAAKASEQPSPKCLVIFGSPNSFSMATTKSFGGNLLAELNAENIADSVPNIDSAFIPLSMEFVTKANPDIIFFISMYPNPSIANSFKEEMAKSSLWQGISAVKTGRIYYLAGNLFTVNPGTKIDEALEILYKDLYAPDSTKEIK